MPSKNSYAVFVRAAVLSGVRGHLLKTVTSKSPLLSIMRQKSVRSASRIRVKLIKRPGRHVFVFELEPSTLVLFAYDSIANLYNCNGHARVFVVLLKGKWIVGSKKYMEFAGTTIRVVEAGPGLIIEYHMRPALMVEILIPSANMQRQGR